MWAQLSFVLSHCTRLTDRQTDRILIARPCLHSMQRGKKWPLWTGLPYAAACAHKAFLSLSSSTTALLVIYNNRGQLHVANVVV